MTLTADPFLWEVHGSHFLAAVLVLGDGRIVSAPPMLARWVGRTHDDLGKWCRMMRYRLVFVGPAQTEPTEVTGR